jgi:hypothetical protein
MAVTAKWDGWVRTHEEAAQVLRYNALGATVIIEPIPGGKSLDILGGSRQFTIVMDAAPSHAVNNRDFYALPCKARQLGTRARELCTMAQAALAPLVLKSAPLPATR